MKKLNITFWIVTSLFGAFMLFTAIPDVLKDPEAMKFIGDLGYPDYFVPFIGVAKILGVIAILVPGFPRLTEWAYAGLFFDLFGAVYSAIAVSGFDPMMLTLLIPFALLFWSRYLFHKRLKA